MNNKTVVLIHGFFRTEADMATLKSNLMSLGYNCVCVSLPTTFGTLEDCKKVLQTELDKSLADVPEQPIHLIGHSMGGLIIRSYLASNPIRNLGRCVLIAPPNNGSKLADLACRLFPPIVNVFKPLTDLKTNRNQISLPINRAVPDIGIIAGKKRNLLLGILLPKENDGRVEVDSTRLEGMKDFVVKGYGHNEIHHKKDIAILVHNFLCHGSFALDAQAKNKGLTI